MEITLNSTKEKKRYRDTRNCKADKRENNYFTRKDTYYTSKYCRFFDKLVGKSSEEVYEAVRNIKYKGKFINSEIRNKIIKNNIFNFNGTHIDIGNNNWVEEYSDSFYWKYYYFKDNLLCVTKVNRFPKNPKYIKGYTNIVNITDNIITYQEMLCIWNEPTILTLNTIEITGISDNFISNITSFEDAKQLSTGHKSKLTLENVYPIINNKKYLINKYNYIKTLIGYSYNYIAYGDKVYMYKRLDTNYKYKDMPLMSVKEVNKKFYKINKSIEC